MAKKTESKKEDIKDTKKEKEQEEAKKETKPASEDKKESSKKEGRWYVVHTYAGHENKVAATLKQKIKASNLGDNILDIMVPTQEKI